MRHGKIDDPALTRSGEGMMIEKIAEALWDADQASAFVRYGSNALIFGAEWDGKAVPWSFVASLKVVSFVAEEYRAKARAILQAIRKPTNQMLNAACAAMSPGKRPTKARVSNKAKQGIRYRAMIDAALEEK